MAEKKIEVEQLQREVALERRPISEAIKELMDFILDSQNDDFLYNPDKSKPNPYQEKKTLGICKLI